MELAFVQNYWRKRLPNTSYDSFQGVISGFADHIKTQLHKNFIAKKTGLYLASSDAGTFPSVSFWASAIEHGPGFMSPENFPRTLANAACGQFAGIFNIKGPNYTLVGKAEAMLAALDHAVEDMLNGQLSQSLVIGIDFVVSDDKYAQFAAILLGEEKSPLALKYQNRADRIPDYRDYLPSALLEIFCQAIQSKKEITIGSPEEGYFSLINPAF